MTMSLPSCSASPDWPLCGECLLCPGPLQKPAGRAGLTVPGPMWVLFHGASTVQCSAAPGQSPGRPAFGPQQTRDHVS